MGSAVLKKWILLGALLLVTLLLVWQGPQPEQTEVVDATKSADRHKVHRSPASSAVDSSGELKLNPRKKDGSIVNLFNVPATTQPELIARPVVRKPPVPHQEKRLELPFDYIGKLRSDQKTTLFLMEGSRLHLVHEGETINDQFRLQRIDKTTNELVWLLLPLNETRKMSMDR